MKNFYRLYATPTDCDGHRQRLILWTGEAYPQTDDIQDPVNTLRNDIHNPFSQAKDDYIRVQQKRRFGWKTLEIINIFEL